MIIYSCANIRVIQIKKYDFYHFFNIIMNLHIEYRLFLEKKLFQEIIFIIIYN